MSFCYLVVFESSKIEDIKPIRIDNDSVELLEYTFEKMGYSFKKPLKIKHNGFSKLNEKIYYKIVPCLNIDGRFFELKEIIC